MGISRVQQKSEVVALPYTLVFMFKVMFFVCDLPLEVEHLNSEEYNSSLNLSHLC